MRASLKLKSRDTGTNWHKGPVGKLLSAMTNAVLSTGPPKQLVKDGVWCVPPADRPKGWEKLKVKEPK